MMDVWDGAFALLSMYCPCAALDGVTEGLTGTPPEQEEVADRWLQLGHCVNQICSAVVVH